MKKLLLFLSFLVVYQIGQSQNVTVTLQAGQFGISSLQPIAALSLVGNPTAGPAVPVAIPLGFGLFITGGKIAVDTSKLRDTIFAVNGLSVIGDFKHFGLGGFLSQNTSISGSNLYSLTLDSMQAAAGRGFRVNFGSDAGYDIAYRDSVTGFWTRLGKGAIGQVIGRPPGGGIAWVNQTGGGGGTTGWDDMLGVGQQQTVDRTIRGGNHTLILDSIQLKGTHLKDPFILLDPFPTTAHTTQYFLRVHTASASNNLSYEMMVDNNANGGPPDDNIWIQGWNIDSHTDPTQASFTQRMESLFGATGWEYHLQWSNPTSTRVYRFESFTFQDHGSTTSDNMLEFHKNTGFEMRGLQNDNAHWAVGNSLNVGVTDATTVTTSSNSSATQVRFIVDGINNTVNELAQAGNPTFFWDAFKSYTWRMNTGSGGLKRVVFDDLGGNNYSYLQVFNDVTTTGALAAVINNSSFYTAIQTSGSAATAFGIQVANSGNIYSSAPAGLNVMSNPASNGKILFGIGATPAEVGRFATSGNFLVGTTTDNNGFIQTAANTTTNASIFFNGAAVDVSSPTNGMLWYNSTTHILDFRDNGVTYGLGKTLTNTATLDFPSTGAGAIADLTITVTGAAAGDAVSIGVPNGSVTTTATFTGWVSSANTVTIRFSPKATEDPASGTFRATVIK